MPLLLKVLVDWANEIGVEGFSELKFNHKCFYAALWRKEAEKDYFTKYFNSITREEFHGNDCY